MGVEIILGAISSLSYVARASLISLPACSFHSAQLDFISGYLTGLSNSIESAADLPFYWILSVRDESYKAVPVLNNGRLFFTDGRKFLVKISNESIEELRALDAGSIQKFEIIKVGEGKYSFSGEGPLEKNAVSEKKEELTDRIRISYTEQSHGVLTVWPERAYNCSKLVYSVEERISRRRCFSDGEEKLSFRNELDDKGVVRRFSLLLDGQLLVDLSKTKEAIGSQ